MKKTKRKKKWKNQKSKNNKFKYYRSNKNSNNINKEKLEEKEKKTLESELEREKENEWFNKIKKNNNENNDKYYRTGFNFDTKINSATSTKSKQSSKTSKTSRKKNIIDKNQPGYIYLLEIQKYKKKRNHTARNKKNLFSNYNHNNPWINPIKNLESKDIKFNQFNKNSYFKNYYSNNNKWPNVLLDSKYKYKNNNNGINAFLNDFPFDLNKKKMKV